MAFRQQALGNPGPAERELGVGNRLLVAAIGLAQMEAWAREPHWCSQLGWASWGERSVQSGSGEADRLAGAGGPAPWLGRHVG